MQILGYKDIEIVFIKIVIAFRAQNLMIVKIFRFQKICALCFKRKRNLRLLMCLNFNYISATK